MYSECVAAPPETGAQACSINARTQGIQPERDGGSTWQTEGVWVLPVNEAGIVIEPETPRPRTRSEVFTNVSSMWISSPPHVIHQVDSCYALACRFAELAGAKLKRIDDELRHDQPAATRARLQRLRLALSVDSADGWQQWVKWEGAAGVAVFKDAIQDWLEEPIDWDEAEYFPREFDGRGMAVRLLTALGCEVNNAIGIVIVEDNASGRPDFVARLRVGIEAANSNLERLGLPICFERAGA